MLLFKMAGTFTHYSKLHLMEIIILRAYNSHIEIERVTSVLMEKFEIRYHFGILTH